MSSSLPWLSPYTFLNQGHASLSSLCRLGSSRMGCYQRIHIFSCFYIDLLYDVVMLFIPIDLLYLFLSIWHAYRSVMGCYFSVLYCLCCTLNFNTIYFLFSGEFALVAVVQAWAATAGGAFVSPLSRTISSCSLHGLGGAATFLWPWRFLSPHLCWTSL